MNKVSLLFVTAFLSFSCSQTLECPAFDGSEFNTEWTPIQLETETLIFSNAEGMQHIFNLTKHETSASYTIEPSWTPGQNTNCYASSLIELTAERYRLKSELGGHDSGQRTNFTLVDSLRNNSYFHDYQDDEHLTDSSFIHYDQIELANRSFTNVYQVMWSDSTLVWIASNRGIVGFAIAMDTFSIQ